MPKIEVSTEDLEAVGKVTIVQSPSHQLIENSERRIPLLSWGDFEGVVRLREWAGELKRLQGSNDGSEWDLFGRAVLIQTEGEDQAILLSRLLANEAGVSFGLIDGELFSKQPDEILQELVKLGPVLVYITHSAWIADPKHGRAYAELIAAALKTNSGLVLMAGTDDVEKVAEALRAPGVFDRSFVLPLFSSERRGKVLFSMVGEAICSEELLKQAAKVGMLLGGNSIHLLGRFALHLKRLNHREKRKIEFSDLIDIRFRGTSEGDASVGDAHEVREQVAYHEAGHAAVGILDSDGAYVPEYASISGAAGMKGFVISSLDAQQKFSGDFTTYWDFRHQVRIALGGRAAEELIYGPEKVCTGASGDLAKATAIAINAFAQYGFAPGMGDEGQSASNLAVMVSEIDQQSLARLHELTRQFLAAEYKSTLALLGNNRQILNAIKDRLMVDPVVDQVELKEIIKVSLVG